MANQSTKVPILVRSLVLSSPNFRSHPCSASDSMHPGLELTKSFLATVSTASSVMSTGNKNRHLLIRFYHSTGWNCFARIYPLQNRCDALVDRACTIFSQFITLKNPPFLFHMLIVRLCNFLFRKITKKRSMTFLHSLIPKRFSQVHPMAELYVSFTNSSNDP